MIIDDVKITRVKAKEGYLLTNGEISSALIYLGKADTAAAWWEIPDPEYSPDEDGSYLHPYHWEEEISVRSGLWYYVSDPLLPHEAAKSGVPASFYDAEYFNFVETK